MEINLLKNYPRTKRNLIKRKKITVDQDIFDSVSLTIYLEEFVNELDEVILNSSGLSGSLLNDLQNSGIIKNLNEGQSYALVSDAGMPSICDPGEDLIKEARSNGLPVICIPGPCAAITALVTSGLPSSKFIFQGFLPKKASERKESLLAISRYENTSIIFEAPHRLKKLLYELKEYCGGDREIRVSRELTKRFEQHVGDNVYEVIDFFKDREVIGEITVVINGINKSNNNLEFDSFEIKKELNDLIKAGLTSSAASKYLAKKNNLPKSIIYNLH